MSKGSLPRFFVRARLLAFLAASTWGAAAARSSENREPVLHVFRPTEAEIAKSSGGKFVIFTREELGREGNFLAGAWECLPDRPEIPITKRVEFCHSSWNANPLLDVLAGDDRGEFPRFVRLQVNAAQDHYSVHLYDIDYRTWAVRCIWQGSRLAAFGIADGKIFCRAQDRWMGLDAGTGKIEDVPFEPVTADGDYWIVRKPGRDEEWSYDRKARREIGCFRASEAPARGYYSFKISPDGKSRGILCVPLPERWIGGLVSGMLTLQRTGHPDDVVVPVEIFARRGSGFPLLPYGVVLEFSEGGFVLKARKSRDSQEDRIWRIDLATGEVLTETRAASPEEEKPLTELDGVPVPEFLRARAREFSHFGRGGFAPAFLMHKGLLSEAPAFGDCQAGVSPDGRHVIFCAEKGPLEGTLVYGDLLTGRIVRWKLPDGLRSFEVHDFSWIDSDGETKERRHPVAEPAPGR